MDYQFNLNSLSEGSGINIELIGKLVADVKMEFPNDSMMQELHLRRYLDYEKNIKPRIPKGRKAL